jgi:lipoprotein-anchoring transpeptidase ErfK/SrfK
MQINNISNPKALRAGDTIKVINGPFHCRIYRSTFTMDLYLQDTFVRSFSVGLGKPGMETPTGRWIVKPGGKLLSPTWTDPDTGKTYEAQDSGYPLGVRWIGLEGLDGTAKGRTGFAIHGTKNPKQLGMAGSRGCIRLDNDDVKLVYDLLMPSVSQVVVVE